MVFLFFIPLPVPAWLLIGFWFASQLFSGFASFGSDTVGAGGGVAYFAHIGGFVAGVCWSTSSCWGGRSPTASGGPMTGARPFRSRS